MPAVANRGTCSITCPGLPLFYMLFWSLGVSWLGYLPLPHFTCLSPWHHPMGWRASVRAGPRSQLGMGSGAPYCSPCPWVTLLSSAFYPALSRPLVAAAFVFFRIRIPVRKGKLGPPAFSNFSILDPFICDPCALFQFMETTWGIIPPFTPVSYRPCLLSGPFPSCSVWKAYPASPSPML